MPQIQIHTDKKGLEHEDCFQNLFILLYMYLNFFIRILVVSIYGDNGAVQQLVMMKKMNL